MKVFRSIRKKYKIYTSVALFVFTALLIAYLFPKERRFAYEFYKGKRWDSEDLYAQFSFPLHKSPEQLKRQKDSVQRNFHLCYAYDAKIIKEQLDNLDDRFNDEWIKYSLNEFKIKDENDYQENPYYSRQRELQEEYHYYIDSLFRKVYLKGIIQLYEISGRNQEIIILKKGNIAEEKDFDEFYTMPEAYKYITEQINNEFLSQKSGLPGKYRNLVKAFDFSRFLVANVTYDEETTNKLLEKELDAISETEGFIEAGTLIIAKNQFVTSEKYRILESYKIEFEKKLEGDVANLLLVIGRYVLILFCFFVMFVFLYNFRREILYQPLKTSFILIMVLTMMLVAIAVDKFGSISYYIIPFAILPILIRTFYDERVALFIHINTILMAALMAPKGFEFIFLNIIAGIVAIFSLTNLYHRSRFLLSAFFVGLSYAIIYFGITAIQGSDFSHMLVNFRDFGINSILVLSSFLLIYMAEKIFGFLSDTTLMELSDTNQALLRKMSEVAPGTFQHSLQVANLAEAAIMKIGGNPLLIRTGAMYHDIGKMEEPAYFIENQTTGFNPHDFLEFKDSAEKIISHVINGEEMARKHNLPEPIIDFIKTHHGTTTVQYFYKSYIKKYPEREDEVEKFTYPGPKPFSKETAVLMMADAVEAASRSLGEYNEETIGKLVDRIVSVQRKAGQFDNADITFKDLTTVKDIFKTRLKNMYHIRISYPK
jgi:cyclic-di-AMP phosphodiesterase PgpH